MNKPYRVLVGSFQQRDEDGQKNEFSRGDLVRLTDEEAAEAGDAVEPWGDPAPAIVPAAPATGEEVAALKKQVADAEQAFAELADTAAATEKDLREQLAASQQRIAELEAAAAAPPATEKAKGK